MGGPNPIFAWGKSWRTAVASTWADEWRSTSSACGSRSVRIATQRTMRLVGRTLDSSAMGDILVGRRTGGQAGPMLSEGWARHDAVLKDNGVLQDSVSPSPRFSLGTSERNPLHPNPLHPNPLHPNPLHPNPLHPNPLHY